MPSDAKKKRDAKRKEAAKLKGQSQVSGQQLNGSLQNGNGDSLNSKVNGSEKNLIAALNSLELAAKARATTGVLASHPRSRDLKIHNFSITFHGEELLSDTKLELSCGQKYGLVGLNGSGKSSLLSCLGRREVPIPDHIDIYQLTEEIAASDKTALQAVMDVDNERARLEKELEELLQCNDEDAHEQLMDVYERLDEIGADTAEARAGQILFGLGFSKDMQNTKCKDFSEY